MDIQANINSQSAWPIATDIAATIFRAYDIRGVAHESLRVQDVYTIARAFATQVRYRHLSEVVVAYDGRLSSPLFSQALIQGLRDSGCDVIDIGCVPSPVLYYATTKLAASGVMLTGSHNPQNYNGVKMILDGESPSAEFIQQLYHQVKNEDLLLGHGRYRQVDIRQDYLDAISSRIQLAKSFKVVLDCGNGVAGNIAPKLFQALGCEVIPLFCEVDGNFPHHHPDPSQPDNLAELRAVVQAQQADIGFAFDGDADRLGVVTETGEIIWPDQQLMLYAQDVLRQQPGAQIIFDVKCSRALAELISREGGKPVMYKTGHSLIKRKLHESGAALAGEMSGHVFFNQGWFGFDDALYTGARLLNILAQRDETAAQVFAAFPTLINTPELHIPMADQHKFSFVEELCQRANFVDATLITIDGLRVEFADGWGLIRVSNTTPCLVLRFEAESEQALSRIQLQFRQQLLALMPGLSLPF